MGIGVFGGLSGVGDNDFVLGNGLGWFTGAVCGVGRYLRLGRWIGIYIGG